MSARLGSTAPERTRTIGSEPLPLAAPRHSSRSAQLKQTGSRSTRLSRGSASHLARSSRIRFIAEAGITRATSTVSPCSPSSGSSSASSLMLRTLLMCRGRNSLRCLRAEEARSRVEAMSSTSFSRSTKDMSAGARRLGSESSTRGFRWHRHRPCSPPELAPQEVRRSATPLSRTLSASPDPGGIVKSCGSARPADHAATSPSFVSLSTNTPFRNVAPARTSATRCAPLT